jgi:hypothetical protein
LRWHLDWGSDHWDDNDRRRNDRWSLHVGGYGDGSLSRSPHVGGHRVGS